MSVHEPDRHIDYAKIAAKADRARRDLGRPLTYAEKIIYGHLDEAEDPRNIVKGETYINLRPDRVAMQVPPPMQDQQHANEP
jgi:aconitate hydratase